MFGKKPTCAMFSMENTKGSPIMTLSMVKQSSEMGRKKFLSG